MPSKVESVVLVYDNNDYGKGIAEGFKAAYTGNLLKTIALSTEEQDYALVIKQIQQAAPEGIVFINGNDTTLINELKALEREGLWGKYKNKLFTAYVLNSQKIMSEVNHLLEGVHQVNVSSVEAFGSSAESFMKAFESNYQVQSNAPFLVLWAEAFSLTLDAIQAGNLTSESIRNYITAITPEYPRKGLIGEYYFDKGQAIGVKYVMQQVQNGQLITL